MRSERERLIARRGVLEARLALLTSNPNTPDELGDRLRAQLDEVAHELGQVPLPLDLPEPRSPYSDGTDDF